jgi:hypothetical protein
MENSGPVQACNGIALPLHLPLPHTGLQGYTAGTDLKTVSWRFVREMWGDIDISDEHTNSIFSVT